MRLTIYACALILPAVAARAEIIPIQCLRGCEVAVNTTNNGVSTTIDHPQEHPYPAFPFSYFSQRSSGELASPYAEGDSGNDSVFMNGDQIMSVGLDAYAETGQPGPSQSASSLAQAYVSFEFQVTSPQIVTIHTYLSSWVLNGPGLGQAAFYMDHDGLTVFASSIGVGGIDVGEFTQDLTWEFSVGDWVINLACMASVNAYPSTLPPVREDEVSVEVRTVPAPASLAAAGLLMLVVSRRRRRS